MVLLASPPQAQTPIDALLHRSLWRRTSPRRMVAVVIMVGLLAGGIWSCIELRINLASLVDSVDNAVRFVGRMVPLDFPPFGELAGLLGETLAIVIVATVLSILLSVPVALLSAGNTTPGPVSHALGRFGIVLFRAVPDLVLAIIFFRVFGLGGLPGILALGLHSVGMVAKLYADALEELPAGAYTAIQANGSGWWQRVTSGFLPLWAPQLVSIGLYRFDINLRGSVLLGYVGVGGIGLAIADALRALDYQRGMALALVVLVLCIVVEMISGAVRQALHGRGGGNNPLARRLSTSISWVRLGTDRDRTEPGDTERGWRTGLPPWTLGRIARFLGAGAVVALVIAALLGARIDPRAAWNGLRQLPQTLGYFFPASTEVIPEVAAQMLVTLQIALASTLLGALLALPVGILAARNVFPHRRLNTTFRVVIVCVRGIPELILAIIFVVISGLGAVAGTLALSLGAVGMLGKLVADSLEETDVNVQEALRANGATRWQVFFGATLHQVLPAVVSHLMYVLDNHVRSATLLGVVGAGGIGFLLLNAARVIEFPVVTTIVIAILAVVLVIEALSIAVRKALA